jgi:hypothetical protein
MCVVRREGRRVTELDGSSRVKLDAQAIGFGGGMTEAEVTDGAQPGRQHMTEVAARKLNARQGQCAINVLTGAVLPAKGYRVLVGLDHAGVGEGGARDVSAEVFESAGSGTAGLDVDAPIFAPDLRIHWPVIVVEQPIQVLAEGRLEVRQVQQKLRFFDAHELVALVQAGARDQAMQVRMELQLLSPGVQDGDETVDGSAQSFIGRQLLAQGPGGRGEEQVIGLLVARTEEATAQFCWQSKGDQEVGCVDQL